jgi:ABC-type multidrug transport system ATPase subunit
MLERFGFTGDRLTARIGDLSGGERRRLQLLRLLLDEPNVLLLDEPTNDLDIETLTVVEDFLDSWPGTLVVVSHDRYFLERVTDVVYAVMGDASLGLLPGGVDEYLERRTTDAAHRRTPAAASEPTPPGDAAVERAAKKELARFERQIDKLSVGITRVHAAMAEHSSDYERLAELDAELKQLEAEKDALELAWLEAAVQT